MKKMTLIKNMALCSLLAVSMLTGCAGTTAQHTNEVPAASTAPEPAATETPAADTEQPAANTTAQNGDVTMNYELSEDFSKALQEFIENSGCSQENYMASPTSFRAALALAVAGADTETKEELIHAMGFSNMDEVNAWYNSVTELISDFDKEMVEEKEIFKEEKKWLPEGSKAPDGSLSMLNSIWNNTDRNGKFGKSYLDYVKKNYRAEANNVNSKNITNKVNSWVNKGTNGLIPAISNDLSMANAVLVNTLYLKSAWTNTFEEFLTSADDFTTIRGEKVEKEFMSQQEHFMFYEDDHGKLVILPLHGGVNAVFVLGEIEDVQAAMMQATYEDVIVKLPKFEIESDFSQNEFIEFLQSRGAGLAFTESADFSIMCPDTAWMISDIIQKTRIKVDEEGLEAAAATAILMVEGALLEEIKPREFIADEPFKFYICGGQANSEILFFGQVVE